MWVAAAAAPMAFNTPSVTVTMFQLIPMLELRAMALVWSGVASHRPFALTECGNYRFTAATTETRFVEFNLSFSFDASTSTPKYSS